MYRVTAHAHMRLAERGISVEEVADCLAFGRTRKSYGGETVYYRKRVSVVIDEWTQTMVTAYRMSRRDVKRAWGRGD